MDLTDTDNIEQFTSESITLPEQPPIDIVRWHPNTLMPYILKEKSHINKSYLFIWDCLYTLLRVKKGFVHKKQIFAVSLYSPYSNTRMGKFTPPESVLQSGTKLCVTFSLQVHSYLTDESNIVSQPVNMYLTQRAYYWQVEFFNENTQEKFTEKFITINLTIEQVNSCELTKSLQIEHLRYLYCVLNLSIYAILSGRLFTPVLNSDRLTTDMFTDTIMGVDSVNIAYLYFVIKDKSVYDVITAEPYANWVYCRDIINRQPALIFNFICTDRVLFHILCFYCDQAFSNMALTYLSKNTNLARNIKWSLLMLQSILEKPSIESTDKRIDRLSNITLRSEFLEDFEHQTYSLVDNTEENNSRLYIMAEYYPEYQGMPRPHKYDTYYKNWYKVLTILPLFVKMDKDLLVWLLDGRESLQPDKLNYLYRQLASLYSVNSFKNQLSGLIARVNPSYTQNIIINLTNNINPIGEPLISWKDLISVKPSDDIGD